MEIVRDLLPLWTGIAGAAVGALIKSYIDNRARERRALIASITEPSRLIALSSHIESRVQILIDGQEARDVAFSKVRLTNVGNKAVESICLRLNIVGEANLLSTEWIESNNLPDEIDTEVQPKSCLLTVSFLNPGDELGLRLLTTNNKFTVQPIFRKPDVKFRARMQNEPALPNVFLASLFENVRKNLLLDALAKIYDPQYRGYVRLLKEQGRLTREELNEPNSSNRD